MNSGEKYFEELKKRAKQSKVYRNYQLTGLQISEILGDERHKSLYIRLAKKGDQQKLLQLAKDVSERKGVANKGAYFMTVLKGTRTENKKNGK